MRRLLAVAAIVLCAGQAPAQTDDPATNARIAGLQQETQRLAATILQRFREVAGTDEQEIIDRLTLNIDRNDFRISQVGTDGRSIVISMGFLIHSEAIAWALAYEQAEGVRANRNPNTDRVIDFANYYVDGLVANNDAQRLGRPTAPLRNYLVWSGTAPDRAAAIFASPDQLQKFWTTQVLASSLALVLGHEIGHNVLRHVPVTRPLGPKEETDADAYGVKLSIKAGYFPMSAIGTFILYDRFERLVTAKPDAGNHPPALCRWFRAFSTGWDAIKSDSAMLEQMRAQGRAADLDKLAAFLRQGEDQAATLCPSPPPAQLVCDLIVKFLENPPTAFISERGSQTEPDVWESKSRLPNATCTIDEKRRANQTNHRLDCDINERHNISFTRSYRDSVARDISVCLAANLGGGGWTAAPIDNDPADDFEWEGMTWSRNTSAGSYEVKFFVAIRRGRDATKNGLIVRYMTH